MNWALLQIRRRAALLVLAGGAGALFIANILAKRWFPPAEFTTWAYLTTILTFFFSFSLLGSEQLIVRSARELGGRMVVPRDAALLNIGCFLVFLAVFAGLLDGRIFKGFRLGILAVPVLVSVGLLQVVYQLERVRNRLVNAQFVYTSWRFVLIPLIPAALALSMPAPAEKVVLGALLIGLITATLVLVKERRNIAIAAIPTDSRSVFLPFLVSLGTIAILNLADRTALEYSRGGQVFSNYVYLQAILASPFNILAGYFGFREAVAYRQRYSRSLALRDAGKAMALAGSLVLGWSLVCYFGRQSLALAWDPVVWAMVGLVSVLRCGYQVLSAAMGVHGSAKAIYAVNAATLVGLALFWVLASHGLLALRSVVCSYALLWGLRFLAYARFLAASPCAFGEARSSAVS